MTLNKIVFDYRKSSGLTLDELAKKTTLSKSFLSKIENGEFDEQNVSLDTIIKLAKGFDVKVKEILSQLKVMNESPVTPPLKLYLRQRYGVSNQEAVKIIEDMIKHLKK